MVDQPGILTQNGRSARDLLVEEKWSGEVKLDGYGTLVVFNDTSELISSQAGPRNF